MKNTTKCLLEEIQKRFPLTSFPYKELALKCNLKEDEVFSLLKELKEQGILRQISAIFDPSRLGYKTTLVAAQVKKKNLERAIQKINAYPGVSHNYLRNHQFNIWFTIAVPPEKKLEEKINEIMHKARINKYLVLPVRKIFKIALILDLEEESNGDEPSNFKIPQKDQIKPDSQFINLVKRLQEDLPLVRRPFQKVAHELGLKEEEILEWIKEKLEQGIIRRFAGLIKHTKAGFKGNIMVAWHVPQEKIIEIGKALAGEKGITHCYERVSYPDWPYNLYSMIHTKDKNMALKTVERLAQKYKIKDYLPLKTIKELKKIRLKLFWHINAK